jgi:hypothetical protein
MRRFSEMVGAEINPELFGTHAPVTQAVEAEIPITGHETPPSAFEKQVFNVLVSEKTRLGIREVWRCKNALIDGLIDLDDGRRLGLEVKYRMNWLKACQSGWQLSKFLTTEFAKERPLSGAVIFFETFSGDWARKAKTKVLQAGWNHWYIDHHKVEGLRVDLIRLHEGNVETYRMAYSASMQRRP